MIKKLIEAAVLLILAVGLVYLFNDLGPIGADTKTAFKYLWLGFLGIAALVIVALTVISLTAIILALRIPFIRSLSGAEGGSWAGRNRERGPEGFIKETVGGALKDAFGSLGGSADLSSRLVTISTDKYPSGSFAIKTAGGDITLCGHELGGAKAELEILEQEEGDTEAFFEDGEIKLRTRSGKKSRMGDVKIYLPRSLSRLNAESVSGDIAVSDFTTESDTAFKGVNGDISLSRVKNSGELLVKTVSGDVKINESQFNSLLTQSISGDITVKETAAETAALKTVSGDIDYAGSDIKNPTVKTVSGSIKK